MTQFNPFTGELMPSVVSQFLTYANSNHDSAATVQASGYFNAAIASNGLASGWLIFDQYNNLLMRATVTAGVVTTTTTGSGAVAAITSGTITGVTINSSVIGGTTPAVGSFGSSTSSAVLTNLATLPSVPAVYASTEVGAPTTSNYRIAFSGNGTLINGIGTASSAKVQLCLANGVHVNIAYVSTIGPCMFVGGSTTPSARLHLVAGNAAVAGAPLKLTAGTNLTTPENGAIEFDGTHLYITIAGVRQTII